MKALVVCSGDIINYKLLDEVFGLNDFIVCADGGLEHIMKINKIPDIVIGDLDSIDQSGKKYIKDNNIRVEKYPVMKDMTDTQLSLEYLIDKGYKDISILAGLGGNRMDHSLANIFLLKNMTDRGIDARIIQDSNIIYHRDKDFRLKRRDGYNTSIIALSDKGIRVSLKGFLYPLDRYNIEFSHTIGISNEIIDDYGDIIIHSGHGLIIESKD